MKTSVHKCVYSLKFDSPADNIDTDHQIYVNNICIYMQMYINVTPQSGLMGIGGPDIWLGHKD